MIIQAAPPGGQPQQQWVVQQPWQQRQLVVSYRELRYERVEPEPELRQRPGEPEQQQQDERL